MSLLTRFKENSFILEPGEEYKYRCGEEEEYRKWGGGIVQVFGSQGMKRLHPHKGLSILNTIETGTIEELQHHIKVGASFGSATGFQDDPGQIDDGRSLPLLQCCPENTHEYVCTRSRSVRTKLGREVVNSALGEPSPPGIKEVGDGDLTVSDLPWSSFTILLVGFTSVGWEQTGMGCLLWVLLRASADRVCISEPQFPLCKIGLMLFFSPFPCLL